MLHGTKNLGQEIINKFKIYEAFFVLKEKKNSLCNNIINDTGNTFLQGSVCKNTDYLCNLVIKNCDLFIQNTNEIEIFAQATIFSINISHLVFTKNCKLILIQSQ